MTGSRRRRWRLAVHDCLASTSDFCRERALSGEPDGLAVLARRQTGGRGTAGRSWQSPAGNLYLSVLLRPVEPARTAAQWSLLAAVALVETLAALLPDPQALALKWPNDVLLHGRKLAGILSETAAAADGMVDFLVIGFGVNLAVAPPVPDRPTACLAERVPPPAPEAFARALLDRLDRWQAAREAEGFAPVRTAWLAHGPAQGAPIVLRSGATTREGGFAGLAADGSLLLATAGGIGAFAAGEVLAPAAGGA
ncbi:MAG: biotin--[acetyl-CoA-carboxylase] ligase [Rhodospirillales bacterium]|nr:biotin--[acetyl-CoA-carboxylase] ligase [Rhodospirillales bacterium]